MTDEKKELQAKERLAMMGIDVDLLQKALDGNACALLEVVQGAVNSVVSDVKASIRRYDKRP